MLQDDDVGVDCLDLLSDDEAILIGSSDNEEMLEEAMGNAEHNQMLEVAKVEDSPLPDVHSPMLEVAVELSLMPEVEATEGSPMLEVEATMGSPMLEVEATADSPMLDVEAFEGSPMLEVEAAEVSPTCEEACLALAAKRVLHFSEDTAEGGGGWSSFRFVRWLGTRHGRC